MDEGIVVRPWAAQLDAHDAELEREAMTQHLTDIAIPGDTVIVESLGEHWGYSLIGWCIVGIMVCCIALALVAIQ